MYVEQRHNKNIIDYNLVPTNNFPTQDDLIEVVSSIVGFKVDIDTSLFSSGICNSLHFAEMVGILDEKFNLKIEEKNKVIDNFDSVRSIYDLIVNPDLCKQSQAEILQEERLKSLKQLKSAEPRKNFLNLDEIIIKFINKISNRLLVHYLRFRGAVVGRNVKIQGNIAFKLKGPISNIKIGDNVTISSDCDFRIREKGMIILESNVYLDQYVRLVA